MRFFAIIPVTPLVFFSFFLLRCSTNSKNADDNNRPANIENGTVHPDSYLKTGFYYLSEKGGSGIEIKKDHSDETYFLNPNAFVSVKNIDQAKLEEVQLSQGKGTNLCLSFDKDGQEKLKTGSTKALNQKIGVVVAGHLLYVITVQQPMTDPLNCIILIGYTESEMRDMLNKVKEKE